MHALPTAIPIAKQHKNYILYLLLLLYLLIIMSKDMERQSNRVSEQQRCAPGPHWMRSLCSPTPGPHWTRPLCTPAPCLHLDEALLHYCSMPPFGRGPSALLLLALYRTRPLLQELFLLRIKPSAEPTTLHAERHCKQTIITYQHTKLSCNIQLEL